MGILARYFDTLNSLRAELAAERAGRFYSETRMTELRAQHAREIEESRRRLAVSQANFEWLSIAFNKSEAERSQLLLGRLGIVAPPMSIQVNADAVPQSATVEERRRARELAPDRGVSDTEELNRLLGTVGPFDDVGERAARALGLQGGEVYDPDDLVVKGGL